MTTEGFGDAATYDEMLQQGIKLSGEEKSFFVEGRLAFLKSMLPSTFQPRQVLDFGCGAGETSERLSQVFGGARVTGQDVSQGIVEHANAHYDDNPDLSFTASLEEIAPGSVDMCYSNGAFHHIPPPERPGVIAQLLRCCRPGGYLAVFENNPWNPGTRMVMRRIPFDRDAQRVSAPRLRSLLTRGGFQADPARYLFVFPSALRSLRPVERRLTRLPAGAQYLVLARRPTQ